jgi:hypothetical protein
LLNKYPTKFTRKTKEQKLIQPGYDFYHNDDDDQYKKHYCWCKHENELNIDEMPAIVYELFQMEI